MREDMEMPMGKVEHGALAESRDEAPQHKGFIQCLP